ncbi:hypothetical protein [Flavobacterium sp. N2038]|uniref:hypothetical protein n=1 Tax=Flavobacterium sp. N2038 TaxID=2986829 RepID=UPI002225078F|nr:hypothetical protein [Flavobacterium sp. N2038]
MKNKLLPLIFVLGCYSAYSQVGIGKLDPNASAQLEVFASDKGVLIPRVKLTGTTDASTIVKGNVESLLVFNTETISDVIPGYYYWFNGKWNKFIISGESTGIAGGQGLPGNKGEAGYPGDSVAMYIDNETGKVYIRDPKNPDKWIQLTSKNGIDGIAGATGAPGTAGSIITLDAIVKDPAGNIYVYVGSDNTVAGRDAEWTSKSPNWVKINGLDGKDGKDGVIGGQGVPGNKGEAGYPGDNIAMYIDNQTGTVYIRDPKNPDKWIPLTGKNGIDGIAGVDGAPGTAGSITTLDAIVKDPAGNIYAYVGTDNTVAGRDAEWASKSANWVKINGLDGTNGITGATGAPGTAGSITTLDAIVKDPAGNIYAYIGTDKTVAGRDAEWASKSPNWVKINGLNGANGITGATGEPGTAGSITTLDAIVKDPAGNIYAYVGTDNTVAGRDAEWASKSPNWVNINGKDGITSFVSTVTTGHDIATYTDAAGKPAALKETITSLKDVVTQETDIYDQQVDVHTLTYTDETGTATPIDLSLLVKGTETLTSLTYDGTTQALVYKDEKGNESEFKLVDLVGPSQTLTSLVVNSDKGTLDYTDEDKVTHPLDLTDAIKEPWFSSASKKGATLNTDDVYTQGWVGIGFDAPSAAPNEKLRVNGAITTVNSYYADYVFEDYFKGFSDIKADYKFKKLEEVDAYIQKNKHLPGITPINELIKTKEGYSFNVSELSIQLLEKTEELYLHIIEQDKELNAKNNEILALQKKAEEVMNHNFEQDEQLKIKNEEIQLLKSASEAMELRLKNLEKLMGK